MSNTSYLLQSSSAEPVLPAYDSNVLSEAAYHLPLMWLAGLSESDLFAGTRKDAEGRSYPACGAVVERTHFVERLALRETYLNSLFAKEGGLSYHIALYSDWMRSHSCTHLCFDWTEYNFLNGDEHERVREALLGISTESASVESLVREITTVIDGARFVTLEHAKSGDYSSDEMSTFFRIFGESYTSPVPWR